jgi:thermitase
MFKRLCLFVVLLAALAAPAAADTKNRAIVRTDDTVNGLQTMKLMCSILNCTVERGLDGTLGHLFLCSWWGGTSATDLSRYLLAVLSFPGVVNAELDLPIKVQSDNTSSVPPALLDTTPVAFYGTTVRRGYVTQPAVQIINLDDTRYAYNINGAGVVAVIDTGVDTTHPALQKILVAGYDFTRNKAGGSEMSDVDQSTAAMVDGSGPIFVNQSTAAMVDQSTAAMVDDKEHAAFGHGTMVAGIIHLVAPTAQIMPLKSFNADGSGFSSDVLRAIYYAAQNDANVVNMSFSYTTSSAELQRACEFAANKGLILVASAGNGGKKMVVYPAALSVVMGVGSTTNDDVRSSFSNYGTPPVWVGAPGEGIVTLYPFGAYAAGWGTSFSAPFVSGTAALFISVSKPNESQAASAVANAKWISTDFGNGRVDTFRAVQAWKQKVGK